MFFNVVSASAEQRIRNRRNLAANKFIARGARRRTGIKLLLSIQCRLASSLLLKSAHHRPLATRRPRAEAWRARHRRDMFAGGK